MTAKETDRPDARGASETFDLMEAVTILEAESLEMEQSVAEGLIVRSADLGEERGVTVEPCFPLTRPERLLVLRDSDGNDLGLLENIEGLSRESREALLIELDKQRFLPIITAVNAIYSEFRIPIWEVDTDRGPRRLALSSNHDAHRLPNRRIYIRDAEGNGYVIPDWTKLDAASQSLIELNV